MQAFNSIIKFKSIGLGIYFGNAKDCPVSPKDDRFGYFCEKVARALSLKGLVVQRQVHGVDGQFVKENHSECEIFHVEGDFLATNQQCIGLGVLTADCLTIVFYDPLHKAVAIAHAGWRGSLAGIAIKTLEMLVQEVGSNLHDIMIYFGPAAGACCYEVQQDFCDQLTVARSWGEQALVKRNEKIYFDQLFFNRTELVGAGVLPENIVDQFSLCTMCHEKFHSFRRQGKDSGRQLSCAWILD